MSQENHGHKWPSFQEAFLEEKMGELVSSALRGAYAGESSPVKKISQRTGILLTQVRQKSIALVGPPAESLFDSVPEDDLYRALSDTLKLWNSPSDWAGDERNVVLTLARIWYSTATGKIAPKDSAANWAIERVPVEYQSILFEAQQAYLGHGEDRLASRADQVTEFVFFLKGEIAKTLNSKHGLDIKC